MRKDKEFRQLVLACPFTDIKERAQRIFDRMKPPHPARVGNIPAFASSSHEHQWFPLRPVISVQRESSVSTSYTASIDNFGINPYDVPPEIESDPMENDRMDSESSALLLFAP